MSDSLLNLLEVLNEVLEEQKLQEQASGGAPTEQELWDLFSGPCYEFIAQYDPTRTEALSFAGIKKEVDEINKKYKDNKRNNPDFQKEISPYRVKKEEAIAELKQKLASAKQSLDGKDLKAMFGIVEMIFKQTPNNVNSVSRYQDILDKCRSKTIELSMIFKSMNEVNLTNTANKQKLSKNIRDAMLLAKNPINNLEEAPLRFLNYMADNSDWITSMTAKTGGRAKLPEMTALLDNLVNGVGWLAGAMGPRPYGSLARVADNTLALDQKDLDLWIEQCKTGDFKNFDRALATANVIANYENQQLYIDKVKKSIKEIFQVFLDSKEMFLKHREEVLKSLLKMSAIRQSDEKNYKAGSKFYPLFFDLGEQLLKSFIDNYNINLSPKKDDSVTSPTIKTSGGVLSKDFEYVVGNFFGQTKGFQNRLSLFNNKMRLFTLNAEEFKKQIVSDSISTMDFMNRVMLLDYFVEFSKGFQASSAGIMFEYFLAGLFGGKVVGIKGDAVDFITNDSKGSAKLLSPGTDPVQALSSFEGDNLNQEIDYIVGRKQESDFSIYKDSVAPLRIEKVDIYSHKVIYLGDKNFKVDGNIYRDGDGNINIKATSKTSFEVNFAKVFALKKPEGSIQIMSTSGEGIKTYRETLAEKLKGSRDKLIKQKKNILNIVQSIFDNLKEGESSARKYVSSGDKEQGVVATKKLDVSKKGIIALSNAADEYKLDSEPNDT